VPVEDDLRAQRRAIAERILADRSKRPKVSTEELIASIHEGHRY
jgi:hypothetical protein